MAKRKKPVAKRRKSIAKIPIPKEDVWNYFCGFFDDLDLTDYTFKYSIEGLKDIIYLKLRV